MAFSRRMRGLNQEESFAKVPFGFLSGLTLPAGVELNIESRSRGLYRRNRS
jgi:hypothetical protein